VYLLYDAVGNRVQLDITLQTHPTQTTNYGYNDIYELTSVTGDQTDSYDYDNVGNRELADGTIYTSNILNQYSDVGGATYGYDLNGNLIFNTVNNYTYDAENRLSSFNDGVTNASYEYDAFNRRVSKTVDGVTTQFVYDGDEVIAEYNDIGALEAEYVTGNSIDEILTMERGGSTYFYHYDGLGSISEITDDLGNIVENYTYDAFGNITSALSSIGNPYYFTGRRLDEESGTYYYRARQYDPSIGRFLQRDPLGMVDSANLYSYVTNNPINFIDPFGLKEYLIISASGGGSAGIFAAEGGGYYVIDLKNKQITEFEYVGVGLGVGFGGSANLEVGVYDVDNISDLSGAGTAVSFFAAAGGGISASVLGPELNKGKSNAGGIAGVSGGVGVGLSGLFTYSWQQGIIDYSHLPDKIKNTFDDYFNKLCENK